MTTYTNTIKEDVSPTAFLFHYTMFPDALDIIFPVHLDSSERCQANSKVIISNFLMFMINMLFSIFGSSTFYEFGSTNLLHPLERYFFMLQLHTTCTADD